MSKVGIIEYEKLVNGSKLMYNNENLTSMECDFPLLENGENMFCGCTNMVTLKTSLDSLTSAKNMFSGCSNVETIYFEHLGGDDVTKEILVDFVGSDKLKSIHIGSLGIIDGSILISTGEKRGTFNSVDFPSVTQLEIESMPNLEDGYMMFYKPNFQSFTCDMPSLKSGERMFSGMHKSWAGASEYNYALTDFTCNMPNLVEGNSMFIYGKIKNFDGDLSGLKTGYDMFHDTKLSLQSIENISETIQDISNLDRNNESDWTYTINGEQQIISEDKRGLISICGEIGSSNLKNVQQHFDKITDKGWYVIRNGQVLRDSNYLPINGYIPFYYQYNYSIRIEKLNKNNISAGYYEIYNVDFETTHERYQGYSSDMTCSPNFKVGDAGYWSAQGNGLQPIKGGFSDKSGHTWEEAKTYLDDGSSKEIIHHGFNDYANDVVENGKGVGIVIGIDTNTIKTGKISSIFNGYASAPRGTYKIYVNDIHVANIVDGEETILTENDIYQYNTSVTLIIQRMRKMLLGNRYDTIHKSTLQIVGSRKKGEEGTLTITETPSEGYTSGNVSLTKIVPTNANEDDGSATATLTYTNDNCEGKSCQVEFSVTTTKNDINFEVKNIGGEADRVKIS